MTLIGNRYQLYQELGRGGMGRVYRAQDRLSGQIVALKQVLVAPEDLQFNTRSSITQVNLALAREFQILASLRHPQIISVLDYGFDDQRQPYFTMELIDHPRQFDEATIKLNDRARVQLLIQVLQALDYLHRRGIVHRDLKPSNVLVDRSGSARVLDFGLAMPPDQVNDIAGTVAYIAPEVLLGDPVSPSADLYAVGVMAYEIFAGVHPYADFPKSGDLVMAVIGGKADFNRLPAAIVEVVQRLMQLKPAERYPSAVAAIEALCAAANLPLPEETYALRESYLQAAKFIGREEERQQLMTALQETLDGQGQGWLIGGESGVGKSRLISEIGIEARVRGALTLSGQAISGGGLPYQLWRDALRQASLYVDLTPMEASILLDLVPDLSALLGHPISPAPQLVGAVYEDRLISTLIGVLRRCAEVSPVVLLLEDLQWSDESLAPLRVLSRLVAERRILVLATYRNDEAPRLPDQLAEMHTLTLRRLDAANIERLTVAMLGETGRQPELLALIERETEGNVFFVVEVLRALAESRGSLGQITAADLPQTVTAGGVQQIIARRLERAPAWGRDLLRLAAVIGRQLDLEVLRRAVAAQPDLLGGHPLEVWLQQGSETAILEPQENRWRFGHDKLREALIGQLTPDEIRRFNRLAAETIEAVYPNDVNYAGALMEHWHLVGDAAKEQQAAYQYGRRLASISYYREMIPVMERSLALLPPDSPQRAEIMIQIGESHMSLGNFEVARQLFEEGQRLAQANGDLALEANAERDLGRLYNHAGDNVSFKRHLERSLELSEKAGDKNGIASAYRGLGFVAEIQAKFDVAFDYYRQCEALYREVDNQVGVSSALNEMGISHMLMGNFPEAERYWLQSLEIKRQIGDRRGIAVSTMNLGLANMEMNNLEVAMRYLQEALVMNREIGDPVVLGANLNNISSTLQEMGQYDEAERFQLESLALKRRMNDVLGIADSLDNFSILMFYRGQPEKVLEYSGESLTLRPGMGDPIKSLNTLHHLFFAHVMLDQREEARALLPEILKTALEINQPPHYYVTVLILAQAALVDGERDEAQLFLTYVDVTEGDAQRLSKLLYDRMRAQLPSSDDPDLRERALALDVPALVRARLDRLMG